MPAGSPFRTPFRSASPGRARFGAVLPPGGRLERARAPQSAIKWLLLPAPRRPPQPPKRAPHPLPVLGITRGASRFEHCARPGLVQRKAAVGHAPRAAWPLPPVVKENGGA